MSARLRVILQAEAYQGSKRIVWPQKCYNKRKIPT